MADVVMDVDKFYLETEQLSEDLDEECDYQKIPVDEELLPTYPDEDLDVAIQAIQEIVDDVRAGEIKEVLPKPLVSMQPELADDYVRNFLVRMEMSKTLNCFQAEWYKLEQREQIQQDLIGFVPDVYSKNMQLEEQLSFVMDEANKYRKAALKAKDTYVKLRKERDYHRMHHWRLLQDKNRLLDMFKRKIKGTLECRFTRKNRSLFKELELTLKLYIRVATKYLRLKQHYASYEPALQQMKQKYEAAINAKMLLKLDCDRALSQLRHMQNTMKNLEIIKSGIAEGAEDDTMAPQLKQKSNGVGMDSNKFGSTQNALAKERAKCDKELKEKVMSQYAHPNDSKFPPDRGINPFLANVKFRADNLTQSGGLMLSSSFFPHEYPVSSLALHPRKSILATTSDDQTWKLWAIPAGHIILTGVGHTDWVSDCDFHPLGAKLATSSGDTTLKIWDFSKTQCLHTFQDHQLAVWGCCWHWSGDFVVSCSLDNTSKVWDMNSLRCRYTLRGHADSVNTIEFVPFSNTLLTSSTDKTVSLWDARTAFCAQTFYGHLHAVNCATVNMKGDIAASCDAFGIVKLWDIRTVAPMVSFDVGPHPANKLTFDPSGTVVAIASNDRTIKIYEIATGQILPLVGHEDAVQCMLFDRCGKFLVSGGSDHAVRFWT